MLQVTDLTFCYRRRTVLEDICLRVKKGEILGILGPNGVGKSTLLKCMLGIFTPNRGRVTLGQTDVRTLSPLKRARQMAYVPQAYPSRFPMTVFDTVLMGRRPYLSWRPSRKDIESVTEVLKQMDLEPLASRDFDCLSGGQQQKVMLARAFVQGADYLLLDEPTSNLDMRHQLEVMELIRQTVLEKGIGVVVAIHDLNMAQRFSNAVVLMNKGRVSASGTARQVLTPRNIGTVFGVRVEPMRGDNGFRGWYPVGSFKGGRKRDHETPRPIAAAAPA
jgi:iron complex transport system ATP-binding protein